MCLAIYMVLAKVGTWLLEQPSSSMIWRHPRMQQLLKVSRVPRITGPFRACKISRPMQYPSSSNSSIDTSKNAVQPAESYNHTYCMAWSIPGNAMLKSETKASQQLCLIKAQTHLRTLLPNRPAVSEPDPLQPLHIWNTRAYNIQADPSLRFIMKRVWC